MSKKDPKLNYGIYNGIGVYYNYKDKERNADTYIKNILNKLLSMFKYENLPATIPQHEMEKIILTSGSCSIIDHNDKLYATYFTPAEGLDPYGRPLKININNNGLNLNTTLKVEDVVIINNDFLGVGVLNILAKYVNFLVENEISIMRTIFNSRNLDVLIANDDTAKLSAEEYLKRLENGDESVILGNKLFESIKTINKNKDNRGLTNDLIGLQQFIKAGLYNEFGLNLNNQMKKERLINAEVNNAEFIYPYIDNMLQARKTGVEAMNEKYNLNVSVEFNSIWKNRNIVEALESGANDRVKNTDDKNNSKPIKQ